MSKVWTESELKNISESLEGKAPEEAVRWAVENFGKKELSLACSFGAEDVVLVDMLVKIKPDARIFYLDTDLLFKETHEVLERIKSRYGVAPERYGAKSTLEQMEKDLGPELWKRQPDKCRDQAPTRANAPVVSWDGKFGLVKVNPLVRWTTKDVWDYITKNNVPYCTLHDKNFPSIGCEPCTRPVAPGEDPRAGRWAGFQKTECGLHK